MPSRSATCVDPLWQLTSIPCSNRHTSLDHISLEWPGNDLHVNHVCSPQSSAGYPSVLESSEISTENGRTSRFPRPELEISFSPLQPNRMALRRQGEENAVTVKITRSARKRKSGEMEKVRSSQTKAGRPHAHQALKHFSFPKKEIPENYKLANSSVRCFKYCIDWTVSCLLPLCGYIYYYHHLKHPTLLYKPAFIHLVPSTFPKYKSSLDNLKNNCATWAS